MSPDDEAVFDTAAGSSVGQQSWEALAILIALRIWVSHWKDKRVNLKVRGDNVGALTLILKMRPSSSAQAIVAREVALLLACSSFPPDAVHTPGVSHVIADQLSRIDAPGGERSSLHPALIPAARTNVPERPRTWYKSLEEPTLRPPTT